MEDYTIYAEITKKQLEAIEKGGASFSLPYMTRKEGSRACFFECEDVYTYAALTEFLDDNGINWQ